MRFLKSLRWLLLSAALLPFFSASARAGVFISVGFAPPVMPVYVQPPCPQPGWMWVPGYWAYGDDGYYWVPGTWVPAPYEGALWTPGFWGWNAGLYMWHPGYWARHVGYYGGINYGFGYYGIGFVGGEWRGREFAYNTAVMRVNTTVIRNTYINRTVIERNTVVNNRVAFNGGPGGIRHIPTEQERMAEHEQHMGRTAIQTQHVNAAMHDHAAYYNVNHGRPAVLAQERPRAMANGGRGNMGGQNPGYQNNGRTMQQQRGLQQQQRPQYQQRQPEQRGQQPQYQQRAPEQRTQPEARPQQRQPEQKRPPRPQGHDDNRDHR